MARHILAGRWTARRGLLHPPVRAAWLFRDQTPRHVKGSEALTLPPALVLTTVRGGGQHKQLPFFFWGGGSKLSLGGWPARPPDPAWPLWSHIRPQTSFGTDV